MEKKFISILLGLCMLLAPNSAIAAEVSFSPSEHLAKQDKPFTTTVVLNTEGENINAVEGLLKIDPKLAVNLQISDSGSVITYWVVRPVFSADPAGGGVVRFSGTIPGGFNGSSGILFSLIIPAHNAQDSSGTIDRAITVSDFKAYKNDGLGTTASVVTHGFSLGDVAGEIDQGIADQLYLDPTRKDDIPPEIFSPQLSQDPKAFNGLWVINFETIDKQSGIDHYEIQETRSGSLDAGKWIRVTPPAYVLQDQELHSFIYVIAIDKQGNERIIKVFPRRPLSWAQLYGKQLLAIMLLSGVGALIYYRSRKSRSTSKQFEKSK